MITFASLTLDALIFLFSPQPQLELNQSTHIPQPSSVQPLGSSRAPAPLAFTVIVLEKRSLLACQGVFYGIYTALFMTALWVWGKRRSREGASFTSAHLGVSIQRLLRISILEIEVGVRPTYKRMQDATKWDTMVLYMLTSTMVCFGDALIIYRTYLVWDKNVRIVALPILIQITYLAIGTVNIYMFSHPNHFSYMTALSWSQPVFPLVVAQNVLTTGLLSYKVYAQHCESRTNGVADAASGVGLGLLAWMLVETAALYTLDLVVMIILGALRHPGQAITTVLIVPTLGMVFVLLSVRVHFCGTPSRRTDETTSRDYEMPEIFECRRSGSESNDASNSTGRTNPRISQTPRARHLFLDRKFENEISTSQRLDVDIDEEEKDRLASESFPAVLPVYSRRNSSV
ncbi:hypothetical protein BJ165DRAFT_1580779 [Panaeolus papilionaceus]|nr:hypothetical protein BJ165DRAFT_1580779 [Panaeolus papilionaceus]